MADQVADRQLASAVRSLLDSDPQLSRAAVDVAVRDGVVTLTGRVDKERDRQRAEQLARSAGATRDVRNLIRVSGRGR